MKFQTLQAFEKHLQDTPKEHFPCYFAVLASDVMERRFLVEKIFTALKKLDPSFEIIKFDLSVVAFETLRDELSSSDLFASKKCIHLKNLEKATKAILEALSEILLREKVYPVILEGEDIKNDPKFYERLKKELVVIDLTKEKPWERKARIVSWVEGFLYKHKKSIQKDVLESLYEKCQKNLSQMMQEVEKLICYVKDSSVITLSHVETLCDLKVESQSWGLSEAVVWEVQGCALAAKENMDQTNFYSMLGQLRYHYQVGLKMKQLIGSNLSEGEVSSFFPTLQPKTLHKYYQSAFSMKEEYFTKAISYLFECEVKSKSQSIDLNLLWVDLLANINKIKTR